MVYKNKEDEKKYNREYHLKNKDRLLERQREWYLKNKEYHKQKSREWYLKNIDTRKEQIKKYDRTPEGMKSRRISSWKYQGIIFPDYDLLYQHWELTSHCDECRVFLEGCGNNKKCCDHDHSITDRDNFRNILCNRCNVKRG